MIISKKVKLINNKANIEIVGNSADLDLFKSYKKNINYYTSVGNLRWQKNFTSLIKAFEIFLKKIPKHVLIFLVKVLKGKSLSNLLKNLISIIKFLRGYCTQVEIAKALSETYIYLQSSISEGLPKSLIEGIASGCPVVATSVGSCKEIADIYGISVRPADHNELAMGIYELFKNKALWNEYHQKCIKGRNNYSWESLVIKVLNFYNSIKNN